jgi:hemerythrin-like domain-containing protein
MYPLTLLQNERQAQRQLCSDLEDMANQLRDGIDQSLCRATRECLQEDLPWFHRHEETFFALLEREHPLSSVFAPGVRLAIDEHSIIETYVFDLGEWLDGACRGVRPRNIEAAAYALRCSFDGMRRHLNWEDAMLIPALSTVVTPGNAALLAEQLTKDRRKTSSRH